MKYIDKEILNALYDLTFNDEITSPPIICIAFDDDQTIISIKRNSNPLLKNKPKYFEHAEKLVIDELISIEIKPSDLNYLISTQPCNSCLRILSEKYKIKEIYIVEPKSFKSRKERENKDNISIHIIDESNSYIKSIDIDRLRKRISSVFKYK